MNKRNINAPKKNKMEFIKKMYIFNSILVTLIVLSAILLSWYSIKNMSTMDFITPLATIASAALVEQGTFSGFYAWKSKCENIHKYPDIQANTSVSL